MSMRRLSARPIMTSWSDVHPECGELRPLLRREDDLNLGVRGVELLTYQWPYAARGCFDLRPVTLDDLLHLRLLLRREPQLAGEAVCHAIGGEARGVARKEPPAADQVEMITSHADENAGEERNDDDHNGRRPCITRH